ncbi:hypothetical protein ACFWP5_36215 [Streptomyces sp. NPDC058469]|uniref:hypothetical protein n=1 Tax=Streptomyces sp. NPDC058469 TaxID=3346514 RepID=UPI00365849A3
MPDAGILLYTSDYAAAVAEIEHHGGRVVHRLSDQAFVAQLTEHAAAELRQSATEPGGSLAPAELLLTEAWRQRRSGRPGPAGADSADQVIARNASSDPALAAQERDAAAARQAAGYVPRELSTVLRGSVAVGVVLVSGPGPDLVISDGHYMEAMAEFFDGADYLDGTEPRASLSFVYDPHRVTVDAPNTPTSFHDTYLTFELANRTFLFWESEAGWAAVREITGATSPDISDMTELWSTIWDPAHKVRMSFRLSDGTNDRQYFLIANTSSGRINIRQVRYDAASNTIEMDAPTWSHDGDPAITAYMPFTLEMGGKTRQYFLAANTSSGRTEIREITYDPASQTVRVDSPTWTRQWIPNFTVYMPFSLGSGTSRKQFFLTINTSSGRVEIREITRDQQTGVIVVDSPVWSQQWDPAYTVCMPFTLGTGTSLRQFFLAANTSSGRTEIREITYDPASHAVQVEAPSWSLTWNSAYTVYVPFLHQGVQYFLTANTSTGNIVIRSIVLDPKTKAIIISEPLYNRDWRYERAEGAWRDAAMQHLGYKPGHPGLVDYLEALRARKNAKWSYVAFVTRYAVAWFGYAGANRLVVQWLGRDYPTSPMTVFSHETSHLFGAADEYKDSHCELSTNGYYRVQNRNCENINNSPLDCLMRNNKWRMCGWSRGQLGWVFFSALAPFTLGGRQWVIGQDSEIGHAVIQEVRPDRSVATRLEMPPPAWTAEWSPGQAVYMPFTLAVGGSDNQYVLTASNTSGQVTIRQIEYDTAAQEMSVGKPVWSQDWNPQYTVYMPFTLESGGTKNQYFLSANTESGHVNIRPVWFYAATKSIRVGGPVWARDWSPQYTIYMPFTLERGGTTQQYFLNANTSSGRISIRPISYDAWQVIQVGEPVWARDWDPGYWLYMPFTLDSSGFRRQYFLTGNPVSGRVNIREIRYDVTGAVVVDDPAWSGRWNSALWLCVPIELNGVQYFLTVDNTKGRLYIRPIIAGGSISVGDPVWELP